VNNWYRFNCKTGCEVMIKLRPCWAWGETRETAKIIRWVFWFMNDLDRNDWFLFILIPLLLVWSSYKLFCSRRKDRFDVSISGKLEGIGARLQKKMITLRFQSWFLVVLHGGERLRWGDIVMKVAQGNAQAVDVVGMRRWCCKKN
jgi:carboxyl-terminal processing protease